MLVIIVVVLLAIGLGAWLMSRAWTNETEGGKFPTLHAFTSRFVAQYIAQMQMHTTVADPIGLARTMEKLLTQTLMEFEAPLKNSGMSPEDRAGELRVQAYSYRRQADQRGAQPDAAVGLELMSAYFDARAELLDPED
jgi:hypothetical protein